MGSGYIGTRSNGLSCEGNQRHHFTLLGVSGCLQAQREASAAAAQEEEVDRRLRQLKMAPMPNRLSPQVCDASCVCSCCALLVATGVLRTNSWQKIERT